MLGLPLNAAMAGTRRGRHPRPHTLRQYGDHRSPAWKIFPQPWLSCAQLADPSPAVVPDARLTCPDPLTLPAWDTSAAFALPVIWSPQPALFPATWGNRSCGQVIGEVGTTGASVNPHLHFEARLGPAGMRISSFGHYDTHTTAEERNNYCVWRVSGWFQVVDPLAL